MRDSIKPGETFATGIVRPKSTALLFDKLWVPELLTDHYYRDERFKFYVPAEVCASKPLYVQEYIGAWYCNNIDFEYLKTLENENILCKYERDITAFIRKSHCWGKTHSDKENSIVLNDFRQDHDCQAIDPVNHLFKEATTIHRNTFLRKLTFEYKKEGIQLTPIYLNPTEHDEITIDEEQEGLEICLDFIPDILEEKLTWEQVLESRKDKKAKMKLDRLRRWFKTGLLKKSEDEIKNILGQKLDDYQWALKKHGIQTVIGGSTSIMSFVSGPTLLKLVTESPLAMVSGGVAIGAGAIAWIGKKIIERMEIKRDPTAYIYEVRKLEKKEE